MAPTIDRAEFERQLASAVGEKLNGQMTRLLAYLGDPPDINNVPASFWDEVGGSLAEAVRPILASAYASAAVNLAHELRSQYQVEVGSGIDWTLTNQAAADWAKAYVFDLVGGINDTSKAQLADAVSSFFTDQLTMGDLRGLVGDIFDPLRAAKIASTEVTRAANRGEYDTIQEIEAAGVEMVPTWQTSEDEHVCEICSPLDQQPADGVDDAGEPYWELDGEVYGLDPAHPFAGVGAIGHRKDGKRLINQFCYTRDMLEDNILAIFSDDKLRVYIPVIYTDWLMCYEYTEKFGGFVSMGWVATKEEAERWLKREVVWLST